MPFVLWFNFLSGFAYTLAGLGIAMRIGWEAPPASVLAVGIVLVFALLGSRIFRGGAYEIRTMGAMILRAAVWVWVAIAVNRARGAPVA